MKRWGFKDAVKIDLFLPYGRISSFREQMDKFEKRKVRFIQGDMCKLSDYIPPESVDMIGCSAVLDLMDADDRNLFYSEAYDVMRPGAVLTISYQWLVHGYHDWDNGRRDWSNATDLGFECVNWAMTSLILRKPDLEVRV